MTPQELAELDSLLKTSSNNVISLTDFKRAQYKNYMHAPHLEALDSALTNVSRYVETGGAEGIGRLIVEMPPRHGKTLTTSRHYPSWHIGRNPDHRMMLVSYGATLAEKNSRATRNTILSPTYQNIFRIDLARDSKAVDAWDVAGHEGGADAMGIGGAATGKGAHVLIIDDPIKNREQAESETWRNKIWDSYTDDLYTRLEPGGAIVVMMTRWHQDDLIGRLLVREGDQWARLRLPAIAEENDPLGRAVGDALWPERYPLSALAEIKRTLGDYSWSALYQQEPVPSEGGIFKRAWFDPWLTELPPIVHSVRYWDLAMSEKTSADYTASVRLGVGRDDGAIYVMDVTRKRVDWGDLAEHMAEVILADGREVVQGVEMKGYMSRAVQKLNEDGRFQSYSVFGFDVDKDKLTRALPFAAHAGAGKVKVLHRSWTQDYVDELCSFPAGAHDDMVDASSGADSMLDGSGLTGQGWGFLTHDNTGAIAGDY